MKNIVIYTAAISSKKYPFDDPYYRDSYLDFMQIARTLGVGAYVATGAENYTGEGVFKTAYTTDHDCPPEEFEVAHDIKADVVYNRARFFEVDPNQLTQNPPEIIRLARSKLATYERFGDTYLSKSIPCENPAELTEALKALPGDRVVVKEPIGDGGSGVYIGTREEVLSKLPGNYPMLAQEFMDTSVGIPGIVKGIHDLRIEIAGGCIIGASFRQPGVKGEYRSNTALGGSIDFLYSKDVPAEAARMALEIDANFKGQARDYAIDFANTPSGFKMIEMNYNPATVPARLGPQARQYVHNLIRYFIQLAETGETEMAN